MALESFKTKHGSCRHRALGFFIVAARLGVPVRYAVSDCHAYVELMDSNNDWVALDLGGCDPGGPRNPKDLNPPSDQPQPPEPPAPKPEKPTVSPPKVPEKPQSKKIVDIRDFWIGLGTDAELKMAKLAWKKSGGL